MLLLLLLLIVAVLLLLRFWQLGVRPARLLPLLLCWLLKRCRQQSLDNF
jgi:hypothetical protein